MKEVQFVPGQLVPKPVDKVTPVSLDSFINTKVDATIPVPWNPYDPMPKYVGDDELPEPSPSPTSGKLCISGSVIPFSTESLLVLQGIDPTFEWGADALVVRVTIEDLFNPGSPTILSLTYSYLESSNEYRAEAIEDAASVFEGNPLLSSLTVRTESMAELAPDGFIVPWETCCGGLHLAVSNYLVFESDNLDFPLWGFSELLFFYAPSGEEPCLILDYDSESNSYSSEGISNVADCGEYKLLWTYIEDGGPMSCVTLSHGCS